jgi:hypothetical protein
MMTPGFQVFFGLSIKLKKKKKKKEKKARAELSREVMLPAHQLSVKSEPLP